MYFVTQTLSSIWDSKLELRYFNFVSNSFDRQVSDECYTSSYGDAINVSRCHIYCTVNRLTKDMNND